MHAYGDNELPALIKKTTVVERNTSTITTETVCDVVPAVQLGDTLDGHSCVGWQTEPYGGGLTKLIVRYESAVSGIEGVIIPPTTYEESGSVQELPIQQHPSFATMKATGWDDEKGEFTPASEYYGITSYEVGSCEVTKTTYYASLPASSYALCGTIQNPGGGYAGANNWMVVATSRRKVQEGLWATSITYRYSAKGYNTTIY